jgi:DNA-directed RNA polymerase subunit RPC12/RpoP
MTELYACPVCGHVGLDVKPYASWPPPDGVVLQPPYANQLGRPSYDVCVRCSFEFGNDDDPGEGAEADSFESYRAKWEAAGKPWLSPAYEQ